MAQASRDQNYVTTLLAVSSVDGVTPVTLYANPTTHRLLVDLSGGGSGTVQTISIATANGLAGTSDGNANNPTLTLSTTVTGVVKGNGTAFSAAVAATDYVAPGAVTTSGLTMTTARILGRTTASSGAVEEISVGTGLSLSAGTLSSTVTGTVTTVSVVSANGFAGSVANATTTPAITLTTTINSPVLAGNGTAIAAATTTGSGSTVVLNTSPTLVTPILGTPTSGTLTNCTGLPVSSGISGLGTGVATALAVNVGSAGAFVTFNGALGTPSSGTVTNLTGTASININGTVGATTPNTGAFTTLSASSTLTASTTIELGNASDTTLSRSSAGVLAVEGVVIPSISSTNTLTNKRVTPRVNADTSNSATPTNNTDNFDVTVITGQTNNITSMTTNLSGTPTNGQMWRIAMTAASGTPTVTWGSSFEDSTVTAPTALSTTRVDVGFVYNSATSKWRCVARA